MRDCERRKRELQTTLEARGSQPSIDRATLEARVRQKVADWQGLLSRRSSHGRQLLREILAGPIVLTPVESAYHFHGQAAVGAALIGEIGDPLL